MGYKLKLPLQFLEHRNRVSSYIFQHANAVRRKHEEILEKIWLGEYSRKPPDFMVPPVDIPIRENVIPGTW